jgi:hypothetical protein
LRKVASTFRDVLSHIPASSPAKATWYGTWAGEGILFIADRSDLHRIVRIDA